MHKTTVLTVSISVFLLLAMAGVVFLKPIAANPMTRRVPTEYSTIQAAINAADPGDIIEVASNNTYYEHLFVNKSLMLVGEDCRTTIIDGSGTGTVISINAPDVEIGGFTIQNSGESPSSAILIGRRAIRNTIRDCIIRNNANGITLIGSNRCRIIDNLIMICSWAGMEIKNSSNNIIHQNTIANNSIGAWITSPDSLNNTLYHNNFIDNLNQAQSFAPTTNWDNGTRGNYWSDYTGADDGSNNRTAGDGIGDTPHSVLGLGLDNNPLIIPTKPFPVVVDNVIYLVAILSNSTVSSFYFSQPSKEIGFYVIGPLNTTGFCRICIPTALMNDTYIVFVNGTEVPYTLLSSNSTYNCLYFTYNFTYNHLTQEVLVIPEFPAAIFLPPFIIVTLIATVLRKRKEGKFKL